MKSCVKYSVNAVLLSGLMGVLLVSGAQAQLRQELPQAKAQEFESIRQILGVIDHTSVRRMDNGTLNSFQNFLDQKDAFYNQPQRASVQKLPTGKPGKTINGIQAPASMNQRAF